MKIKFDGGLLRVQREPGNKPTYSESDFWYRLKKLLIGKGFDVIKKEMVKDGHMVSVGVDYIRSRNMKAKDSFMIWDDHYQVRNIAEDLRKDGHVNVKIEKGK